MDQYLDFKSTSFDLARDHIGNKYESVEDMWKRELHPDGCIADEMNTNGECNTKLQRIGGRDNWYSKTHAYYETVPATIDGVVVYR